MEPPPAPKVWMSMAGRATLLGPTALSPVSCGSPSWRSAMSVDVPPMSKVMRSPWFRRRAACRLPAMPPAGPESTAPAARRTESATPATPPCDCMMSTSLAEPPEVRRQGRTHVGIDHGGAEALVLLDLGEHFRGQGDVDAGQEALQDSARRLLVAAVGVGVEIADGDRAHSHPAQAPHRRFQRAAIERGGDLAVEARALAHAQPAPARREGNR